MVIFGWVFIIIGVVLTLLLANSLIKALACNGWPSVMGELVSSDLKRVETSSNIEGERFVMSAEMTNFLYTYKVNEEAYTSKRVTFCDYVVKTRGALNHITGKYDNKDIIDVYYNPDKPAESVLIPGVSIYNFLPLLTAGMFISVGVVIVFYGDEFLKLLR